MENPYKRAYALSSYALTCVALRKARPGFGSTSGLACRHETRPGYPQRFKPQHRSKLGGTTCLTLLVWYGLICFMRCSSIVSRMWLGGRLGCARAGSARSRSGRGHTLENWIYHMMWLSSIVFLIGWLCLNERVSKNKHLIGKLSKVITSHYSCQSPDTSGGCKVMCTRCLSMDWRSLRAFPFSAAYQHHIGRSFLAVTGLRENWSKF